MIERVCRLAQADPFIQEMPDKYDTYIEQGVVLRRPYVGIIQIRLSVEGHTFLSACNTSSRLLS